jgi:hypothetical protein
MPERLADHEECLLHADSRFNALSNNLKLSLL